MQFSLKKLHFPDDLVGVKMADFGNGGKQALFGPPMSALGGRPEYLGHGTEPDQGRICQGGTGGAIPLGKFVITGHPLGRRHAPWRLF